ncbi:hypothetical protein CLV49_1341 [Labedella gwakjiensis]|uniref:DUF6457 domain-containing protein n=1 Tax=Labedella gwakjiensis TaxID=390269 RepID=A0A2P8GUU0_9MICO|nr:DUF6457 domain-containing protein [Labedella gwakjiensis]PSL37734.1 hypothetical protein CLV49_1341 [Labedella gwakjiensis]
MSPDDSAAIDAWLDRIVPVLDLPRELVDTPLVLDLARDAAHGVARPAAPLTTFLLGLALGRGTASPAELERLADVITEELP